jgi:hypothetical protein
MHGPRSLRLAIAIALVSAAALAYQLLLMRWLAIAHWHPFAVVIISLALLGHGVSGSVLSVLRVRALRRFEVWFAVCALAFALSAAACLRLARAIPFNGLELAWDLHQLGWLSALYLCLAVPFFFAASCFGLAFARRGEAIPLLYGADLAGAGSGALLALGLSWLAPVGVAMAVAVMLAPIAALLVVSGRTARVTTACACTTLLALAALASTQALAPPVNEFKGLAKALLVRDARVIAERHSPYGWLAVVASPRVPLRQAPGLSLANPQEPAPQLGLYTDGDGSGVITRRTANQAALAYFGRSTSALPFRLLERPRVLVLGGGGGSDALQALTLGARDVDIVEPNPQRVALVRDRFAGFAGNLYRDPRVHVHVADARGFLRASRERYDLIVLAQDSSSAAGGAGVQAVAEDYGATVEALRDYRAHLAPGGLLALTRWEKQPPRDALKLFATAVAALRGDRVPAPDRQLAMIRNWDAATLLLKRDPFEAGDIAALRAFVDRYGFDPVYFPGMRPQEGNRFNVLARDVAQAGAAALLSPRARDYIDGYKFDITPARDDRPYFGNFFKWATLPELWRLRAQGSAVLLDPGYLLLVAALAQALPWTVALVLLPLLALPRVGADHMAVTSWPITRSPIVRWRAAVYFVGLGLAFLFIEIACLSRLALLIGHPLLAIAIGLAGFLLFAGAGSGCAQRWLARSPRTIPALSRRAVLAIAMALAWHLLAFALALRFAAAAPPLVRAALGLLTIAPLAFAMGLPFALGLARLARAAPAFVPWAWGLNGCASVIAAIAALLLAIEIGLTATLLVALGLYGVAAWTWRTETSSDEPG